MYRYKGSEGGVLGELEKGVAVDIRGAQDRTPLHVLYKFYIHLIESSWWWTCENSTNPARAWCRCEFSR